MIDLNTWQAAGDTFSYHGHEIFWRRGGLAPSADTPTLTLIHGFPTASWDFYRIWDALCQRFHVLTLDMIGFGFSDKPRDYHYSILDQGDIFEQFWRKQNIQATHLLCHDYGDTVGQELLARQQENSPVKLQSICWLNGGLFPETHQARPIQKLLHSPLGGLISRLMGEAQFRRSFCAVFGAQTQPSESELKNFWTLVSHKQGNLNFHKLIRYMAERRQYRERWVGTLQTSPIPMRVIDGLDDPVSGAHMLERYQELVDAADVVGLKGIGHYPQTEAPDEVLEHFLAFIDAQNRKRAAGGQRPEQANSVRSSHR